MSRTFPSKGLTRKFKFKTGADDTVLASTITVPADNFGIIWKLWISLEVDDETDLENLPATMGISVVIGGTSWAVEIHPYIARTGDDVNDTDYKDLGPWEFDFGIDGLYSGVAGQDIDVSVSAAGTGVKVRANYIYSGD